MRKLFCKALEDLIQTNPKIILLTGDLGFMAFESIRDNHPDRYINMGVSEQNMIGVAAGLSFRGFIPFVYSIAPFVTLRCLEQIRNDVCFHQLPVKLVGNGGGYGYGIMGPTHHGIEDVTVMRAMPGMKVYIPSFNPDILEVLKAMSDEPGPAYLRLGVADNAEFLLPKFAPLRHIRSGTNLVVIAVGPIIFNALDAIKGLYLEKAICETDIDLWSISGTPFEIYPLISRIKSGGKLIIIEENIPCGGVAEEISTKILRAGIGLDRLIIRSANWYTSGTFGSQYFHRKENGLDALSLKTLMLELLNNEC
ncbi:transketolase [Candidatus Parcubacteria bacterium]|nr:MAG: transketolase [Candidatus Parcubacteria bacterium]